MKPTLKKLAKIVLCISLPLMLLIVSFMSWWSWNAWRDAQIYPRGAILSLTMELLQIPYTHKSYEAALIKENNRDIESISHEEWMDMEAECPDNKTGLYNHSLPSATKKDLKNLSQRSQKHIKCLSPTYFSHGSENKMPVHCTNMFNCDTLIIKVYDYVLKYPKVLNNIIKIAEKPCFYIKELPDKKENFVLWHAIDQLRRELHCDNNERPYVVIYILDKEDRNSSQLIVPRIDTIGKLSKSMQ